MAASTPTLDPIRSGQEQQERRLQRAAAATLAAVMGGHILLETATDALFLANVSVERLPFVTIVVAFLALGVARGRLGGSNRGMLLVLQAAAAIGTLAFWVLATTGQEWSFYALYVWSGIITSLVVVRFWLVLADLMTITQGKRLFATIAMGGSLGALGGAGLAAILAPGFGGEGVLLAATLFFAVSAFGPASALAPGEEPTVADAGGSGPGLTESLRQVLANPYAVRVAMLVVLGGMTLTFADYLFKSVLTEEVAAEDLALWLSRIYLGLNLASITMLAIGVTPLVRSLGVDRSLAVLPLLAVTAAAGVLAGGALVATIGLKLADGTLRYSLHKTATELLYLPMPQSVRAVVKGAIDIVGQTAAKAVASLIILALVAAPAPRMTIAAAVVIFGAVWAACALRLRGAYLDVFRGTLREQTIETRVDHHELDLETVGSLLRALGDADDRRVLAALHLLAERGRTGLIPTLIFHHPSPAVVTTALDLFALARREDVMQVLDRMVEHEDANVRAAAARCWWMVGHDEERLAELGSSNCVTVRVSALAGMVGSEAVDTEAYREVLDEALDYPGPEARLATATAARLRYDPVYREVLVRIAGDPDLATAHEAIRAIRASDDHWFTRPLVELLGTRRVREEVRQALLDRGESALDELAARLVDPAAPIAVLRHVPRTLARFGSTEAVSVLVGALDRIESGMVRYKILRGLEWLQRERARDGEMAALVGDAALRVRREFERTVTRSLDLLQLEAALASNPSPVGPTVGGELLLELLEGKRTLATSRLFMMLGLLKPGEDFRIIRSGLASGDATSRASAQELIETVLSREVSNAILGLEMPGSAAARVRVADPARAAAQPGYDMAVRALLKDDSASVRAVALYHAAELGFDCDSCDLERVVSGDETGGGSLQELALGLLQDMTHRGARGSLMAILARG